MAYNKGDKAPLLANIQDTNEQPSLKRPLLYAVMAALGPLAFGLAAPVPR